FGFANALWLLFVCRFVQGFGGGTTGVGRAYVPDTMPPTQRARALGWLSAATSLGVSIGAVLGSFTHKLWGPRGPGVAAAVLVLVNVLFAWKWLPESRIASSAQPNGPAAPRTSEAWRVVVIHVARPLWNVIRHPARPVSEGIWVYGIGMLALNALMAVCSVCLQMRFRVSEQ